MNFLRSFRTMGKIKSDSISAQNAISELVGVDTSDK